MSLAAWDGDGLASQRWCVCRPSTPRPSSTARTAFSPHNLYMGERQRPSWGWCRKVTDWQTDRHRGIIWGSLVCSCSTFASPYIPFKEGYQNWRTGGGFRRVRCDSVHAFQCLLIEPCTHVQMRKGVGIMDGRRNSSTAAAEENVILEKGRGHILPTSSTANSTHHPTTAARHLDVSMHRCR
jgi:hypothetical protein